MIFLVDSFILSAYEIYHLTSFCPVRFLLINLLIVSQEFLCTSWVTFFLTCFFFFFLFDNFIIIYLIVDSFEYIFLGSIGLLETEVHQFSRSVVSDSLWLHESQHARPPCPSPTPGVNPNSCASSRWCHPAISSSVVPFSCPQSLQASESFPMSQLFKWGG